MRRILVPLLFMANSTAHAATLRGISVDPFTVYSDQYGSVDLCCGPAGVFITDAFHEFVFGITMPRDYLRNSSIRLTFQYTPPAYVLDCDVRMEPTIVARSGFGRPHFYDSSIATPVDGPNVAVGSVSGIGSRARFRIMPTTDFDIRPGDALTLALARRGDMVEDTCDGEVVLTGILLEYWSVE